MKYIPKPDLEGVNSTQDHPLKEFSILLVGSFALVGIIIYFSGFILGEVAVQFAPRVDSFFDKIEIKKSLSRNDGIVKNEALEKLMLGVLPKDYPSQAPKISILCSKDINAFALPGANVWITSALLDQVRSEKGLAFVVAHEIGHIQNRDHLRAFGQSMGFTLITALLGFADAGTLLYELPAQISYLGLSRGAETAADTYALERIKSKYSSYKGSDEFFDVALKKDSWGSKIPAILSTHPDTENRKARIQSLIMKEDPKESLDLHKVKHSCGATTTGR